MSQTNYQSELVGVFGDPIAENPTIVMLEAAFKHLKLNWRYLNIQVHASDLANAITGLRAFNMQGINLTIPHKVAVLEFLDEVAPDAALIGAVNTVRREGSKLIGENTDGKGFMRALSEAGVDATGQRVVVLGAGGAARAITVELALAGAAHIDVVNRSQARGETLVALLNDRTPVRSGYVPWTPKYRIPGGSTLIINATSIGLYPNVTKQPDIDFSSLNSDMLVCDVIPNPADTLFLKSARQQGARTLDGLGMLVYQGAIAFKLWTGHDAPVAVMHAALKDALRVA